MAAPFVKSGELKDFLAQPRPRENIPPAIRNAACRGRDYRLRFWLEGVLPPIIGAALVIGGPLLWPEHYLWFLIIGGFLILNCIDDLIRARRRRAVVEGLLRNGQPAAARLEALEKPGFIERVGDSPRDANDDKRQLKVKVRFNDEARRERLGTAVPLALRDDTRRLRLWAKNPETVLHILRDDESDNVLLMDLWLKD